MALRVKRTLTRQEQDFLRVAIGSPETTMRFLLRANIIWRSLQGSKVPLIAKEVGTSEHTVRLWISRFNHGGMDALYDLPRPGAKRKITQEQVDMICSIASTPPRFLGQPFPYWTLDRLSQYLNERKGIVIGRSRLNEILRELNVQWTPPRRKSVEHRAS